MSAHAEAAPQVYAGDRSDVSARLDGLDAAVRAAEGRLDPALLEPAAELAARASDRLRLSGEHTIVALAGATGSGKSSLFNALTDLDLAGVGVRRPTTSWALACAWGPEGASELLQWMGIPARHQVSRMSMLDRSSEETRLDGLVLLDLPDHDSTEVSHHLEMDRLVHYSDLLVWVLDPQKYADAAIHDRYIRPMAAYSDVTLVVLNQIDRIAYEQRDRALEDVRRILAEEGLPDVPVIGVSSTRGDGVDELKAELARRIRAKQSAKTRLASDIEATARTLSQAGGTSQGPGIDPVDREALDAALADAAGAPQLAEAVEGSIRRAASARTTWPPLRLVGRRREARAESGLDPDGSLAALAGSTAPEVGPVERARAETAIRALADKASVGLERPWRDAVHTVSVGRATEVVDALDAATSSADVAALRPARWWTVVAALQWLGIAVLLGGLGWLVLLGLDRVSPLELPSAPRLLGTSLPLAMVVLGLLAAVVLTVGSRVAARSGGQARGERVGSTLRDAVHEVAEQQVVQPVQGELDRYARFRQGVLAALA